MGKVDKFANLTKTSQKSGKKLAGDKIKEEKEQEKATAAAEKEQATLQAQLKAEEKAAAAQRASGKAPKILPGSGTFSKASRNTDDSDDDDDHQRQAASLPRTESSSKMPEKKETAATLKKRAKDAQRAEVKLLEDEEKNARKERVIGRFLKMLVVGYVIEAWGAKSEKGAGNPNSGKPKKEKNGNSKKKQDDDSSFSVKDSFRKIADNIGPLLMLLTLVLLMAAKISEENFSPDFNGEQENFYDILGIPRESGVMDVRKSYKKLALQWHPDKNPDCESCKEKFSHISMAYDTLVDVEKKKAYDNQRGPADNLVAASSTDLTADNFASNVLKSNEIWIVQVFDPFNSNCKSFHPAWEEVSSQYKHTMNFGRIDISKNRAALSFLPQRVMLTPLIYRYVRGQEPEQFIPGGDEHVHTHFPRFVMESFPEVQRIGKADEFKSWWSSATPDVPQIVLVGSGSAGVTFRGAQQKAFTQVARMAHLWGQFCKIAVSEPKAVKEVIGESFEPPSKNSWTVIMRSGGSDKWVQKEAEDIDDMPRVIQEHISQAASEKVPLITVRNHQQLCGASGHVGTVSRNYCLVLVGAPKDGDVAAKALKELAASRVAYAQELVDMASADDAGGSEETPSEMLHIQPVRLTIGTPRWPWQEPGAGSTFSAIWHEAQRASMFVIELETKRIAAVKTKTLNDLFQQVAYEDLKFSELPEGVSVARAWPDPEASVRQEVMGLLTSKVGSVVTFLIVAAGAAVFPEISPAQSASGAAGVLFLFLIGYPALCRRFLAILTGGSWNFPF